jgi:hypothetical protein
MRRLAKETLKRWLKVFLHTEGSVERTSFAFALGVFVACLPPIPWFHTIAGLALAFLLRLNRLAVLAGTYINTPLTIPPLIVLQVTIGIALTGSGEVPPLTISQFRTAQGWSDASAALLPLAWPFFLGSVLVGLLASGIAYIVAFRTISFYRRRSAARDGAATGPAGGGFGGVGELRAAPLPVPARPQGHPRGETPGPTS